LLPHWNNTEGGAELDTSHCFMGRERYQRLLTMLPTDTTVLGIDEHTALILDLEAGQGTVLGRGGATVLRNGREQHFGRKGSFPIQELGPFRRPTPHEGIDPSVWEQTAEQPTVPEGPAPPPADVLALLESRQAARANRDWAGSDALRDRILALGWRIRDTPAGPQLEPA
jgi:hypothetical protein